MSDDTDDISELAKRLRSTDAPPADDRDDEEPLEGFARKFRGGESPLVTALADAFPPDLPLTGLLAEGVETDRPDRELDVRTIEDIDQMTRRVDSLINDLRAFRDTIEYEAERRDRGDSR